MTNKKPEQQRKTTNPSKSKLKELEETITSLKHEVHEKNDKLLRCLADQQNQQKRLEKELALQEIQTKTKYLLELLDLQDLLKKAAEDTNPQQGIKLLIQNLNNFLEKEDIHYIDCKGKTFDHTRHHAVTVLEQPDCEDNIIIDEIKKGYLKGDILLRPSHVVVAKRKEQNNKKQ